MNSQLNINKFNDLQQDIKKLQKMKQDIIKINPKDKKVGNIHNKIWRLIFKQAEVLKHI